MGVGTDIAIVVVVEVYDFIHCFLHIFGCLLESWSLDSVLSWKLMDQNVKALNISLTCFEINNSECDDK